MATAGDLGSALAHSFGLEGDGLVIKQITEVSGLKMEQDVIELKQNTDDGKYVVRKLQGRPKPSDVTLTRPLTDDNSFEKWAKAAQFGKKDAPKGASIIVYDLDGAAIKRYKLANAWPKSLEISTLKAGDTNYVSEKLVLTHEGCEVE